MIGRDCLRGQIKLFNHETKGVEMIAHVDDLFVVGCLKDVQDVCRSFADASDLKRTDAGPKTGNHEVEHLGWSDEFFSRKTGRKFHGDPKHAAVLLKETEMEMCKFVNSLHVVVAKLLDTLADDTRSYMPPTDAGRPRNAVETRGLCGPGPSRSRCCGLYCGKNDGASQDWKLMAGEESVSTHQGQATICSIL